MTPEQARWHAVMAFRTLGMEVYEGRLRPTSLPDLVVMDPDTGTTARVRVITGKRPPRARRLYFDRRRVGRHADAVALVDPERGSVDLRPVTTDPIVIAPSNTESPPDHCYRAVTPHRVLP